MADDRLASTSLGASGLKVAKLWLGTMMFGDQTDEAEAARAEIAALLEAAEIEVGARTVVDADRRAVLHPRERTPLRVGASRQTRNPLRRHLLENLREKDIEVYINLTDVYDTDGLIKPVQVFVVPSGVTLIKVEPDRVRLERVRDE